MSNMGRCGRGVSKCKKTITDFTIEFDEHGNAIGKNRKFFLSWVGMEFRKRIPYDKIVQDVDSQHYEDVWEYIKESWSIPNDFPKSTILKKGKAIMRSFRNVLVDNYVREGKTSFVDYAYKVWNRNEWDSFEAKVSSVDFEAKSVKAKVYVRQNVEPARVGRCGFSGMRDEWEKRLNQLVLSLYELGPHLLSESEGVVLTGTLQKLLDKEKEMLTNDTYLKMEKDVVTEVFVKECRHGGRTRLVSSVIDSTKTLFARKKRKTKKVEGLRDEIDAMQQDQDRVATTANSSPCRRVSSCASGKSYSDLPEIKSITICDIKWPFDDKFPDLVLARGRVYPTSFRTLHSRPIAGGFVKVQAEFVYKKCKKFPVLPQTLTDEIEEMGDTQGQLIQWPMKSIKVLDMDSLVSPLPSVASHYVQSPQQNVTLKYMPEFEQT